MPYEKLRSPENTGVEIINGFAGESELESVLREVNDPGRVQWVDAHAKYENKRGLTIVQNHDTFALKLSRGDQSFLGRLPATVALKERVQRFVNELAPVFPFLAAWEADELSFHRYDDQKIGLSRHRDNLRFVGLVAIVALSGECELVVTHKEEDVALAVKPGDLCLLRAPGLIDSDEDLRPEHSVQNLKSEIRISMMLRANNKPAEAIEGFKFNNWHPGSPVSGQ